MRNIENLVFKGGGVLGMAYAGAIEALEEKNVLQNVLRAAGTSAGSVVALMVSLGYNAQEIKQVVRDTNFKDFEDHWDPLRIATHYGLYKGQFLLSWIEGIIKRKTKNKDITYAQLIEQGYKDLKVFATDLNAQNTKEFSANKTPNVKVAESVRASMSIPLFFGAWRFSNAEPNDHIYVDGGVLYNYPINAFDLSTTLGFFLYDKDEKGNADLKFNNILDYVETLFQTLLKAQDVDFNKSYEETKASVMIDDFGISATNFSLDETQKKQLFDSGKQATIARLLQLDEEKE